MNDTIVESTDTWDDSWGCLFLKPDVSGLVNGLICFFPHSFYLIVNDFMLCKIYNTIIMTQSISMPIRKLTRSNCEDKKYYVCTTRSSMDMIDNHCPKKYYPYKSDCLLPSPQTKTFEDAKVRS